MASLLKLLCNDDRLAEHAHSIIKMSDNKMIMQHARSIIARMSMNSDNRDIIIPNHVPVVPHTHQDTIIKTNEPQ